MPDSPWVDPLAPRAQLLEPGDTAAARATRSAMSVRLMAILLALVAIVTLFLRHPTGPFLAPRYGWVQLVVLAALFAGAELLSVHLHFAHNSHSFSLFEIPLTLGLFFAPSAAMLAAHAVGSGAALLLHRRQSPVKLLFNLSALMLGDQLALCMFHWSAGEEGPFKAAAAAGAAAGTIGASVLSALLVFAVICVAEHKWRPEQVGISLLFGAVSALVSTSLGLIAVGLLSMYAWAAWLLLVPTAGMYLANHAYVSERRRHEGLEFLHGSSQLLHQTPELDTALVQLLQHACATFHAGFAELVFLTGDGTEYMEVVVRADRSTATTRSMDDSLIGPVLDQVIAGSVPTLVHRDSCPPDMARYLDAEGLNDAVIALLRGEQAPRGLVVIGNRLGNVGRFDRDDKVLLETLAGNVAVMLENGQLGQSLDQLRVLQRTLSHQATHDGLTGLVNRTLFTQLVESALSDRPAEPNGVAVMFIDLDNFKNVNDSLGHAAGDQLLNVLARRLNGVIKAPAAAARLGGDEFAVILPSVAGPEAAHELADRVLASLGAPVAVMGRTIPVSASIGVALAVPCQRAADLLRCADAAMYAAKARGKHQVAMFETTPHEATIQRYNTTFDLAGAVARGELEVHYQPIIDLTTQATIGFEALVRWQHPVYGLIGPNAFIPMAEENAAIVEIGRAVLHDACQFLTDCRDTAPGAPPLFVSVNLSARDLLESTLVDDIAGILAHHRVEPSSLVFEITEGLMIGNPDNAIDALTRLKDLGARIALDDFGTGYSSLSQLHLLPVDILKIAQPFIDRMTIGGAEPAFVESIIRLGHALGLTIIAEGIEQPEQARLLEALGCEQGQGFHIAPALPRDSAIRWVAQSALPHRA